MGMSEELFDVEEYDDDIPEILDKILNISSDITEIAAVIRNVVPNQDHYLPEVLKAQNRLLWVYSAIEKDNSDDPF